MPIYDYRCAGCGQVTEVLVRSTAQAPSVCPSCGGALERMPSAPHVHRGTPNPGHTCCGREERCEKPPCTSGQSCRKG